VDPLLETEPPPTTPAATTPRVTLRTIAARTIRPTPTPTPTPAWTTPALVISEEVSWLQPASNMFSLASSWAPDLAITTETETPAPTTPAPTTKPPIFKNITYIKHYPLRVPVPTPNDSVYENSKNVFEDYFKRIEDTYKRYVTDNTSKKTYFDDLVRSSRYCDAYGKKCTNQFWTELPIYGTLNVKDDTSYTYHLSREQDGRKSDYEYEKTRNGIPIHYVIRIPEDGPPVDIIQQAVKDYLDGMKFMFDVYFETLQNEVMMYNSRYNPFRIENASSRLELADKYIEGIKKHIDSYFTIENKFTDYTDDIYYYHWPEHKRIVSQEEQIAERDIPEEMEGTNGMRRLYSDYLYDSIYTNTINIEKRRFDVKEYPYETQDILILQKRIIEIVELNIKDEPPVRGRSQNLGVISRLKKFEKMFNDKSNQYPNNRTFAKYKAEAIKIVADSDRLISDMKKISFIAKVMGITVQEAQSRIYESVQNAYSEVAKMRNTVIENIPRMIKEVDDLNIEKGYSLERSTKLDNDINWELVKTIEHSEKQLTIISEKLSVTPRDAVLIKCKKDIKAIIEQMNDYKTKFSRYYTLLYEQGVKQACERSDKAKEDSEKSTLSITNYFFPDDRYYSHIIKNNRVLQDVVDKYVEDKSTKKENGIEFMHRIRKESQKLVDDFHLNAKAYLKRIENDKKLYPGTVCLDRNYTFTYSAYEGRKGINFTRFDDAMKNIDKYFTRIIQSKEFIESLEEISKEEYDSAYETTDLATDFINIDLVASVKAASSMNETDLKQWKVESINKINENLQYMLDNIEDNIQRIKSIQIYLPVNEDINDDLKKTEALKYQVTDLKNKAYKSIVDSSNERYKTGVLSAVRAEKANNLAKEAVKNIQKIKQETDVYVDNLKNRVCLIENGVRKESEVDVLNAANELVKKNAALITAENNVIQVQIFETNSEDARLLNLKKWGDDIYGKVINEYSPIKLSDRTAAALDKCPLPTTPAPSTPAPTTLTSAPTMPAWTSPPPTTPYPTAFNWTTEPTPAPTTPAPTTPAPTTPAWTTSAPTTPAWTTPVLMSSSWDDSQIGTTAPRNNAQVSRNNAQSGVSRNATKAPVKTTPASTTPITTTPANQGNQGRKTVNWNIPGMKSSVTTPVVTKAVVTTAVQTTPVWTPFPSELLGSDDTYEEGTYDEGTYDEGTYEEETYDEGTYDEGTNEEGTYGEPSNHPRMYNSNNYRNNIYLKDNTNTKYDKYLGSVIKKAGDSASSYMMRHPSDPKYKGVDKHIAESQTLIDFFKRAYDTFSRG